MNGYSSSRTVSNRRSTQLKYTSIMIIYKKARNFYPSLQTSPNISCPLNSPVLRIKNRPIRRNPPRLHIIHHLRRKPLITNHTNRLRPTLLVQPIRQATHIRFPPRPRVPNKRMGIRLPYTLYNLFSKRFLRVRRSP
jgi:hypothetical protein